MIVSLPLERSQISMNTGFSMHNFMHDNACDGWRERVDGLNMSIFQLP